MILDVDIGNTRSKWLLHNAGRVEKRGAFSAAEQGDFFESIAEYSSVISNVRVASVKPSLHESFNRACEQLFNLQPQYAVVSKQFGQLTNAYADVSQMGVDRWLNMIAATEIVNGACVVVSAGSAITVDLLNENQQHLGGFIAPGLRLMRQSLYRDTDQVKLDQIDYDVGCSPATNTHQAVSAGLMLMQIGLIEQSLAMISSSQPVLLLTGGDSERLKAAYAGLNNTHGFSVVRVEPDLVFKGLALVL